MQLKLFETKTLAFFDGGSIAAEFDRELKKAIEDCRDRPGEERVRKVVLQVQLTPQVDNTGETVRCSVSFQAHAKLPSRRFGGHLLQMRKNGTLVCTEEQIEGGDEGGSG
jgi:hypothetical protein